MNSKQTPRQSASGEARSPLNRAQWRAWLGRPAVGGGLWGMVHLAPLPGAPAASGRADACRAAMDAALGDVDHLVEAGFRSVVVENYGDIPFFKDCLPSVTVAAMGRILGRIRDEWPELRIGVNCLRNDAEAALALAASCEADAIRINVHSGAAWTDQGLIEGNAAATLRRRAELGLSSVILADLRVKHAAPVAQRPLGDEAADLRLRGQADALLLTGGGTGKAADQRQLLELREALPDTPIVVASGVTAQSAALWAGLADGAIVGSTLMHGGKAGAGVDPKRAHEFFQVWCESAASTERDTHEGTS